MTFQCHNQLVIILAKQLAPILKDIIGIWLLGRFDSATEVARLAQSSFEKAFPDKLDLVLKFTQNEIIEFIINCILRQTAESMSDVRYTSPEEISDKYARVVSGAFLVLQLLLGT